MQHAERSLTINSNGITTLGGAVGTTRALSSLSTDASGTVVLTGGNINTQGAQTFNDPITLGDHANLNSQTATIDFVSIDDNNAELEPLTAQRHCT